MQELSWIIAPVLGVLAGIAAIGTGVYFSRRKLAHTTEECDRLITEAQRDADSRAKELLVAAHETNLASEQESEARERALDEREAKVESRATDLDRGQNELGRRRKEADRQRTEFERRETAVADSEKRVRAEREQSRQDLQRIAGLTVAEARDELMASIEQEARKEADRTARKVEEEGRQDAERRVRDLIVQASQRVNIRDVMESTVSFIELPNDEMKGRIIGKEGRNIRALEMATGIDLIVDDTPRSIWISSFDPLRREIARVAIDRLLEDGRIHPARIEEVVQKVAAEIDDLVDEKGAEAAFSVGISDLHPKLARLVGKMRYHSTHGQNLLKHGLETSLIAGYMAEELGARTSICRRAGLLHEVGQVADDPSDHPALNAAELCAKYQESEEVVEAIRSLHPDVQPSSVEALLLNTANRLSENRPGARKENLAVFIERLRRLEAVAVGFAGVDKAYAVKSGRELRVIVNVNQISDGSAFSLAKRIAKAIEREVSYPGQVKVSVIRETRAVRYAV